MFFVVKLFFLYILTSLVTSEAPDCGIRNQFRGYCFSFEYCTDHRCDSEKCGYFRKSTVLLKIKSTRIIPQCAVTNSTKLKTISGINSNIHVLASGSFADLPNLENILLPYNLIRELHHGIFHNVNVELIDLSWNKIIYISEGAFKGVTGLKYLNLSRNELSTIPVRHLPNNLVDINLSFNFLETIALYGASQQDLKFVDISHNNLEHVALSFDNVLKKLDLSNNRLHGIDFYDINDCEDLKIPANLFSEVPQFLIYSKIKRVALHPNPWKCDQLQRLWTHLQDNEIEEVKPNDTDTLPLCSINTYPVSSRFTGSNVKNCEDDIDCPDGMLCRSRECSNPCPMACDSTNICAVRSHEIHCLCPDNLKKNPRELFSKCYDVDCFSNTDCSLGSYCSSNKTCQLITFGAAAGASFAFGMPSTITIPSGESYVPSAGFDQNQQVAGGSSGYSAGSSAGSSASYAPREPVPLNEPPPLGGNSYGGNPNIPFGNSVYSNKEGSLSQEPWWYEVIPKLVPTNTIM